jgi:hypothetical protein
VRELCDLAWHWNVTPEERRAPYPCDRYLSMPHKGLLRAVDVEAPAGTVFRWICQLKVAPYSYDWIDNRGRRSPRELTPGLERLACGQAFMIGRIVEFEPDRHITSLIRDELVSVFGPLAITYAVGPTGPASSRLVVKLAAGASTPWERARRTALAWGDLVMMRKQLLTLKALAERSFTAGKGRGS